MARILASQTSLLWDHSRKEGLPTATAAEMMETLKLSAEALKIDPLLTGIAAVA